MHFFKWLGEQGEEVLTTMGMWFSSKLHLKEQRNAASFFLLVLTHLFHNLLLHMEWF
uniref:Uncharacterized protein n=1 Tax=Picea sitchensis TaxID=3332 RepID=A9NM73_PICSI|nr:unknown [Picea sitchensis]